MSLESDTAEALNSAAVVHYTTGALTFATCSLSLAPCSPACACRPAIKRYLGVRYTVASGPLTAGKFDAFLTHDVDKWAPYARRGDIATTA